MNHKPRSRAILEEMRGETKEVPKLQSTPQMDFDIPLPHRSGTIVDLGASSNHRVN